MNIVNLESSYNENLNKLVVLERRFNTAPETAEKNEILGGP